MPFLLGAPLPAAPKPFDPSILPLTSWFRAPYDGTVDGSGYNWRGTDSADPVGSGIHDAKQNNLGGTHPPADVGPTINGFTVARFNGTDQGELAPGQFLFSSSFRSEGTFAMLFRLLSVTLPSVTNGGDPPYSGLTGLMGAHPIVCDNDYIGNFGVFASANVDGTARIDVVSDCNYPYYYVSVPSVPLNTWLLLWGSRSEAVGAGHGVQTIDIGAGPVVGAEGYGAAGSLTCFGGVTASGRPHANFDLAESLTMNVPSGFTRTQIASYVRHRYPSMGI